MIAGSAWPTPGTRAAVALGQPAPRTREASDTLYVHGLAAPFTINTMPDSTLEAYFDHGDAGDPMPADGGNAAEILGRFAEAGVDPDALAAKLQSDGARSFADAWDDLLKRIESQTAAALSA